MFASYLRFIPILWSKRRGRTTLQTKIIHANSWKWWFFEDYTQKRVLSFLMTSKREFSQVTTVTSGPSKKFSVGFYEMKYIFAGLLMIISISQSKRNDHTTLRSDPTVINVSKWWFFENLTQKLGLPYFTSPIYLKTRVFSSDYSDFRALEKVFCRFSWHQINICRLAYDHIYLSKQTEWTHDA